MRCPHCNGRIESETTCPYCKNDLKEYRKEQRKLCGLTMAGNQNL